MRQVVRPFLCVHLSTDTNSGKKISCESSPISARYGRKTFTKVSSLLNVLCKMTAGLTFENLQQMSSGGGAYRALD